MDPPRQVSWKCEHQLHLSLPASPQGVNNRVRLLLNSLKTLLHPDLSGSPLGTKEAVSATAKGPVLLSPPQAAQNPGDLRPLGGQGAGHCLGPPPGKHGTHEKVSLSFRGCRAWVTPEGRCRLWGQLSLAPLTALAAVLGTLLAWLFTPHTARLRRGLSLIPQLRKPPLRVLELWLCHLQAGKAPSSAAKPLQNCWVRRGAGSPGPALNKAVTCLLERSMEPFGKSTFK